MLVVEFSDKIPELFECEDVCFDTWSRNQSRPITSAARHENWITELIAIIVHHAPEIDEIKDQMIDVKISDISQKNALNQFFKYVTNDV